MTSYNDFTKGKFPESMVARSYEDFETRCYQIAVVEEVKEESITENVEANRFEELDGKLLFYLNDSKVKTYDKNEWVECNRTGKTIFRVTTKILYGGDHVNITED